MTYEELLQNHAGKLIEELVTDVITREPVNISFEFEDDEQWSAITMQIYEEDKQISLRLHAKNLYQLYFTYYDDEDEFFKITKTLTPEEILLIPKRLRQVMAKVFADKQSMQLPVNFLSR